MIDDNIKSNSTVFFPYFLKSHSSEGPLYISRENSFFDTKISSKEFQLQYNKSFNNFNQCIDNKLSQMINKTNYTNILMKVETLLSQMETIDNDENYMRLSDSFFELTSEGRLSESFESSEHGTRKNDTICTKESRLMYWSRF